MAETKYSFCPYCGKKLTDNLCIYCPECGEKLIIDSNRKENIPAQNQDIPTRPETIPEIPENSISETDINYVNEEAAAALDVASGTVNKADMPKIKINKKLILAGTGCVAAAVIIILLGCMITGIIDGARLGIVNKGKSIEKIDGYLAEGNYEAASEYALLAQKGKSKDTDFLKELVYKINPICSVNAYKMVENYVNKTGSENADTDIQKWIEIGHMVPTPPEFVPGGGTYIYPPVVKLIQENKLIGHGVYYTTDGSNPDTNSALYYNGIDIPGDCTLKLIAVNGTGETTPVVSCVYEIDGNMQKQIDETLEKARTTLENAVVGDEVGQCLQSCKDDLQKAIDDADTRLQKEGNTTEDGNQICGYINGKITALEESKVTDVDKTDLNNTIQKANDLYNSSANGTYAIYLDNDLNILKNKINEATALADSRGPEQEELNAMNSKLNDAISTFNYAVNIVKTDLRYNKYKGYYSYNHDHTGDILAVTLTIDKVSAGKLYGSFTISHMTVESDGRLKLVSADKALEGVTIKNGKIAFDISGTSEYVNYNYSNEYHVGRTETKEYTSGVEVNLVEEGIIQVAMTNIGNTVDFNETLYRN